jgi:hypothetical protein
LCFEALKDEMDGYGGLCGWIRWWDNLMSMWMMYEVEVNGLMDGMVCSNGRANEWYDGNRYEWYDWNVIWSDDECG